MSKGYLALVLDDEAREDIFWILTPKYKNIFCHHITVEFGIEKPEIVGENKSIEIIGYACGDGVESLVVSIDGEIRRKDGGFFHITLSLEDGRKPFESNKLLENGWMPLNSIEIKAKETFVFFEKKS